MAALRRVTLLALSPLFSLLTGCGSGDLTPRPVVEDQMGHIRNVGIQYMQYRGRNAGKTLSESGFKSFMTSNKLQPDQMLVSPRDRLQYVIRYGFTPKGDGAGDVVVYEKVGVQGRRFVVTGMASVQELDEAEFRAAVPDAK